MTPALIVLEPGLATTVQDSGRRGVQHLGVPVAGALDTVALAALNMLLGNDTGDAALEAVLSGPLMEVAADEVRVAAAGEGVTLEVTANGETQRVPSLVTARAGRGARLRLVGPRATAVAYLGVAGGFDIAPVLGSRATYVRSALGGLDGRRLAAGDRLPLAIPSAPPRPERRGPALDLARPGTLRVMPGPHAARFTAEAHALLTGTAFTVTAASDRMGLRLDGAALRQHALPEPVSEGIAAGSIQVPPDGQPIVLLADRQTIGGYAKIATVVTADIAAAGRLRPGDTIRFETVTRAAALAALQARRETLLRFAAGIADTDGSTARIDTARLAAANLVSGVTAGDEPI